MDEHVAAIGRRTVQRNTLYQEVSEERREAGRSAAPLAEPINTPAKKYERSKAPVELVRNELL